MMLVSQPGGKPVTATPARCGTRPDRTRASQPPNLNPMKTQKPKISPPKPASGAAVKLPLLGTFVSRGDGSYVLRPQIPGELGDTWLTMREAAKAIGNISPKSLYVMLGDLLVFRRPLPRKTLVSLRSALEYRQASHDPEFWTGQGREQLRLRVRAEMDRLTRFSIAE